MNAKPERNGADVDAPKCLQTETAADPPSLRFGATWLDALLPAILDRAFKGNCDDEK